MSALSSTEAQKLVGRTLELAPGLAAFGPTRCSGARYSERIDRAFLKSLAACDTSPSRECRFLWQEKESLLKLSGLREVPAELKRLELICDGASDVPRHYIALSPSAMIAQRDGTDFLLEKLR